MYQGALSVLTMCGRRSECALAHCLSEAAQVDGGSLEEHMTAGEESVDDANLLAHLKKLYEEVDSPPEGLVDCMIAVTWAASGSSSSGLVTPATDRRLICRSRTGRRSSIDCSQKGRS